jgi:hypothetical protein
MITLVRRPLSANRSLMFGIDETAGLRLKASAF